GYAEIADHFRQQIKRGDLAPGDRLPTLREIRARRSPGAVTGPAGGSGGADGSATRSHRSASGTGLRTVRFPCTSAPASCCLTAHGMCLRQAVTSVRTARRQYTNARCDIYSRNGALQDLQMFFDQD
ncbi:GntR family transcriptional regulator, partial [Streptomyces achromogenes]|uniref:GntR family transcriptional regulator n=1 Tax=Streptomyces achromogenes TaxID=67255 RepID=UPI0033E8513B